MLEAGVIPDEISQRNLAVAFHDNPQMASDLVHEAKQIQASPSRITVLVLLKSAVCFQTFTVSRLAAYWYTAVTQSLCML